MAQPDYDELARAAHAAIHSGGHVTAAQVLREAFEAQLAEVRTNAIEEVAVQIQREWPHDKRSLIPMIRKLGKNAEPAKSDPYRVTEIDRQHMAAAIFEQLSRHDGNWVAVRMRGAGWEIVAPRTQEAILEACETIERDVTITDLQAREAEHLATIARLRDFVQGMINLLSDPKVIRWDGNSPNRLHIDGIAHEGPPVDFMFKVFDLLLRHARTALNGESDHG